MLIAFKGGFNWSRATRIWQNVRHAFGIPALTKSRLSKNQSYEVLTPNRRYEPPHVISNNVSFWQVKPQMSLWSLLLGLETPNDVPSAA